MPNRLLINLSEFFLSRLESGRITLSPQSINPSATTLLRRLSQHKHYDQIILFIPCPTMKELSFRKRLGNEVSQSYQFFPFINALRNHFFHLSNELGLDLLQIVLFALLLPPYKQHKSTNLLGITQDSQITPNITTNDTLVATSRHILDNLTIVNTHFIALPQDGTVPINKKHQLMSLIATHLAATKGSAVTLLVDLDNSLLNTRQSARHQAAILNKSVVHTLLEISYFLETTNIAAQRMTIYFYTARLAIDTIYNGVKYLADNPRFYNSSTKIRAALETLTENRVKTNGTLFSEWYRYQLSKGDFLHRTPCLQNKQAPLLQKLSIIVSNN